MNEKDKIKIISKNYGIFGIEKGDLGEIFLLSKDKQKAFVIIYDEDKKCKTATTVGFQDFEVIDPFDDGKEMLNLLEETKKFC